MIYELGAIELQRTLVRVDLNFFRVKIEQLKWHHIKDYIYKDL